MPTTQDEKRRIWLANNYTRIQDDNNKRIESLSKPPQLTEDSKIRVHIHGFIREKVKMGISEKEILKLLRTTFKDKKYKKYEQYFENWIKDAMKNIDKKRCFKDTYPTITREEEER